MKTNHPVTKHPTFKRAYPTSFFLSACGHPFYHYLSLNISSSILRNDKEKVPLDQCPGVVYEIKCESSASYIVETGNTLAHRYQEHMKSLTRYRNAVNRLNRGTPSTSRGRPPTLDPRDSMEHAAQTSAVAQHAAQCTGQLQAKVLCKEGQFMIQKIKEALYIKYNSNINRDPSSLTTEQGAFRKLRYDTR
ncbi:hypothetical protein M514_12602 [Trichuris suis]|uniref:GIY-YIG domain-containing protein n=1 Tax=Trichuris suis TaxID=68888 RepID=A0A085MTM7_9BILA|nr:hypothetical protein M514_12602 [Trichuris suis]